MNIKLLLSHRTFSLSVKGVNPAGFTGNAGGTPLLGVYNPVGSGVLLVFLVAALGIQTEGTGVAGQDFAVYYGLSGLPTGTTTSPVDQLNYQKSGSAAIGFVNTAMTGSAALANVLPFASIGVTSGTAAASQIPGLFDLSGFVVAPPGALVALGASGAGIAASMDASLIWAEL